MKTEVTYKDLMERGPCYDPQTIGMPTNYSASIPDFIGEYRDKVKNKQDIIWAICHNDYMTDKDLRLFAVWCAREALKLIKNPDPRSVIACDVAERFANGKATKEELAAAWAAGAARAARAAWAARAARDAAKAAGAACDAAWAAKAAGAAGAAQIDKLLTYFK